ncbi:chondroitinase family polysaccharide lyase [Mariniflexile ostreae]|uniref:Chondroitinase family polysaccharide lyase n=1 Tax=Mariniflexile ostreae TaxID=1520892 RepID=A0ABV5FC66_9FLAO
MTFINYFTVLLTILISVTNSAAQVQNETSGSYWNLENGVPENWQGERLELSDKRYKVGLHAVKWLWEKGRDVMIESPQGSQASFEVKKKVSQSLYSDENEGASATEIRVGGFMGWIYNEKPIDDYLQVEFGQHEKPAYQFSFYLNFSGWRACWIRFSEMEVLEHVDQLDYMKFIAPKKHDSGILYFDRITFNGEPIHGRSTPDQQLPFINPPVNQNHWGGQWFWETNFKYDIALESEITKDEIQAINLIETRLYDIVKGTVPHQDENWYYKDNFDDLLIVRNPDGSVSGRPIVSADEYNALLNDVKPLHLAPIFMGLARGYALADDDQSKEMFLDLFDHFVDQGYDYGSATGTQHHVGYQMEGIPESFLLMKEALKKSGRAQKASQILAYWYGTAESRKDISVNELQGVADLWNTKAKGRLISVLLMEDTPEKVRALKALSRFFSNSLQYSSGLVGGITPDRSLFHHGGLYPAYMTGALMGMAPVVYALSNSTFKIDEQATHNMGQSLLLTRMYSNKYDWPIGLSGRQVFAGKMSQRVIDAFGYVAKSGGGKNKVNKELASAYMRLAQPWEKMYGEFQNMGIQPEKDPEGFQVVNYACLGLHRRDDWLVSIKGYSKYVWSGEIYAHDNRWGRYMSYGNLQINNSGDPINGKSSGFVQDGWDWNRFPGTTTIHLPLDKLYCPVSRLMSRSDETFCGSSSLLRVNGIFGMKLHENETLKNFTPDHRARKSVFFFNDCIVALGSNIENSNTDYLTETTLFQLEAEIDNIIHIDGAPHTNLFKIKLDSNEAHKVIDNKGNIYFIPKGQKLTVARQKQFSKHNKSERDTEGVFGVAYLDHGKAPKKQSYEYAIVVNGKSSGNTPNYNVLQKDYHAHIVHDNLTGITGFVLFEPGNIKHNLVRKVSKESLVMCKTKGDSLIVSLCSPSINLSSDASYSNKPSVPVIIELELKGKWHLKDDNSSCKIKSVTSGKTVLQFECVDGKTNEVELIKLNT